MTVPAPGVELFMGGSWVNVSGWVDLGSDGSALTITRGRDNEQSDLSAGVCSFSVVNDDGRFTLGNLSGAYSPDFKQWIPMQITIAGVREFYGYMSQAVTTWDDDTGLHSHTAITCTDLLGMMAMSPVVTSWADSLIGALNPLYWWKMNEPEGSARAEESVSGTIPLVAQIVHTTADTDASVSDVVTFGVAGTEGLEADSMVQMKGFGNDYPHYGNLQAAVGLGTLNVATTGITILCVTQGWLTVRLTLGSSIVQINAGPNFTNGLVDYTIAEFDGANPPAFVTVPDYGSHERPSLVAVTLTGTSVGVVGYATDTRPAIRSSYVGALVSAGRVFAGSAHDGMISHLAIIPGIMSSATLAVLKSRLLGDGSAPVSDWLDRATSAAGYAATAVATFNRTMDRPALKGSNPAAVGSALANSSASMFAVNKFGVPTWYDFSYCPPRIVIATGEWDANTSWAPDSSLYYSEVQFDGVVANTVAGAFPRRPLDLPALLPAADEASLARWFVNAQDIITGPRLSSLTIDMLASPNRATYQSIDLRRRINLQSAPAQVPLASVMTVEGYTTTITKDSWVLQLSTAPDPRFVLGDAISGVLASNYRVCPLG